MNFQRIIVRSQLNHTYLERKIPIVGLCVEMINAIGVSYGDRIIISSPDNSKRLSVICAPLTPSMQRFHDEVTHVQNFDIMTAYMDSPKDDDGVSDLENLPDRIHPIFIDAANRRKLGIGLYNPIRIMRSFKWEFMKKLNSLSSMNIIALPVLVLLLSTNLNNLAYWGITIAMSGWLVWGLVTSTTYNSPIKEL